MTARLPEPCPPQDLGPLQAAFGRAMATPMRFDPQAEPAFVQQPELFPVEIVSQMLDHPTLDIVGLERLTTYNRQYWFRLLTVLQQEYPLLLALLGLRDFNHMAMSYLEAFPPHSPSLRDLSNQLAAFLSSPVPWNQPMLRQAAALEYAYIQSFDAAEEPRLDPTLLTEQDLLERPLRPQPHLCLIREDWNLVDWRSRVKLAEQPEQLEVTPSPQPGFWAIYRGVHGTTTEPLAPLAYALLEQLLGGSSVNQAIENVCADDQAAEAVLDEQLGAWFAYWIAGGLFAHPSATQSSDGSDSES